MNLNNIVLEALYEIKCTRRCVLFHLSVILGLSCTFILPFLLFSSGGSTSFTPSNLPWYAQALHSSIPFTIAYCYNIIQVLLVIFMASNDLRRTKLTAMSALDVHPQFNMDVIIGRFLGRVVIFSCINILLLILAIWYNLAFCPRVFNILYYLFYWLTLTFPTLIYFLGLSTFITRSTNNQGISILLLLVLVASTTTSVTCDALDPLARHIPNLFSDFTGHPCLYPYLLHRAIYLFGGIFLLTASVSVCRRIPNHTRCVHTNLFITSGPLAVILTLVSLYYIHFDEINQDKEQYHQLYLEHDKSPKTRVISHDIVLQEIEDGRISATSNITIVNRNSENTSLVLYLNPSLKINKLICNHHSLSFKRVGQIIITDKLLAPRDTCNLTIDYEGTIDNSICHLDIPSSRKNPSEVNRRSIFHFGNQPAFCTENYKLFTPECLWYPVSVPPTCFAVSKTVNFSRYSLTVIHDDRHVAISQGKMINEQAGKTIFLHNHDLQSLSLCIGKYKKISLFLDSVQIEAYYRPDHEYVLSCFDLDTSFLKQQLGTYIFSLQKDEPISMNYNLKYPYSWLRLVETPTSFCSYPKSDEIDGEMVQCGLIFLPEKLSTAHYHANWLNRSNPFGTNNHLNEFIGENFHQGEYNIQPLVAKNQSFVNSNRFPMLNEVLRNITDFDLKTLYDTPASDYYAVKYMANNSLLDAINDINLSSSELRTLIQKKSRELSAIIGCLVTTKEFSKFCNYFLKSHRFMDIDEYELMNSFNIHFNMKLEDILEAWYHRNQLPVYKVDSKCYSYTLDESKHVYNICYKVYNAGNVDGVIRSSTGDCWNIPRLSCKNISIKNTRLGNSYSLELPMSQNLPGRMTFKNYVNVFDTLNMHEGIFDADSNYFKKDSSEFIWTVLDPQCKQVTTTNWAHYIYHYLTTDSLIYGFQNQRGQKWILEIGSEYTGFPIQGGFYKPSGSGKNYIEWSIRLKNTGDYELSFYIVKSQVKFLLSYENTLYFSIYNGSKKNNVSVTINEKTAGWVPLGKYKFINHDVKVVFHDKQDFISTFPRLNYVTRANAIKLHQL